MIEPVRSVHYHRYQNNWVWMIQIQSVIVKNFRPDRVLQIQHSSMRLTMTIRSRLTPTTLNYRCSRSLTNEPCISRVSLDRGGRGGMGEGVGRLVLAGNCPWTACGQRTPTWIKKSIKVLLIAVKQTWIQKSITVSLIAVNKIIVVTYCSKCHRLSLLLIAVNGITLMGKVLPSLSTRFLRYNKRLEYTLYFLFDWVLLVSLVSESCVSDYVLYYQDVTMCHILTHSYTKNHSGTLPMFPTLRKELHVIVLITDSLPQDTTISSRSLEWACCYIQVVGPPFPHPPTHKLNTTEGLLNEREKRYSS